MPAKLFDTALSQTEKNSRWSAKHDVKKYVLLFKLTDPDDKELYEFLHAQKKKRQVILEALRQYKKTLDK